MSRASSAVAAFLLPIGITSCRSAPSPREGSQLVLGQVTSAVTLDPHGQDHGPTSVTLGHFYESLVTFGADNDLRPRLAERWENPTDTTWRFHLRRGVVFHDGRPFGAEDVAASLRRALAPASHIRHFVRAIAEIHVVDDTTLDLTTRTPSPVLLNKLVFVPIVPRDAGVEPITRPVGTGPYRFVGGEPGGPIEGARFNRYWGDRPAFERVVILPLPDPQERARAVDAGRADVVSQYPTERWNGGLGSARVRLISRRGLMTVMLGFSLRPGTPMADIRVRRAVAAAVDRETLVRDAMQGLGAPLDQMVPPSVVGHASGLEPLPRGRAEALRLLREAGLREGFEAPLYVADLHEDLARGIITQLGEVGVRLKLKVVPQNEFYDRWTAADAELTVFGWQASTGDASGAFEPLLHSPGQGYGRFNRFAYANPALDSLIELSEQIQDPKGRGDVLARAAGLARDDLPVLPLAVLDDLYAVRPGLDWSPRLDRRVCAFDVKPRPPGPASP
jgi:peptide/nickel transport system substrate-binding protein